MLCFAHSSLIFSGQILAWISPIWALCKRTIQSLLWPIPPPIVNGNSPFNNLAFQVPMQYCSLQCQTLLPLPVTSTTGCCFCYDSIFSFFLELFLHWSPVAYWSPIDLESSSFSVLSFCLFILFMGFSRQDTEVVCHSLLQWTTFCQNSPPWPVCLGWPYTAWLIVSLS